MWNNVFTFLDDKGFSYSGQELWDNQLKLAFLAFSKAEFYFIMKVDF